MKTNAQVKTLKERVAEAPTLVAARTSIEPSPTNPRKTFNLTELVESVKEMGVVTPLWVRRLPKFELKAPDMIEKEWRIVKQSGAEWEVVETWPKANEAMARGQFEKYSALEYGLIAGERRWRAAGEAGLAEVPVKVIDCDEREAWKLQQVENLQREDLTPLEEAEGFRQAVESKLYGETVKASVAALAQEVGKSRSHIFGRMALLKLSEPVRQALEKGELDHSLAVEVSKVLRKEDQKKLLEEIAHGHIASVRHLRSFVENRYMRPLDKAPFDLEQDGIVGIAQGKEDVVLPACAKCPKRTGNMLDEYPDLKARPNVCTDVECFQRKALGVTRVRESAFKAKGHEVIEAGSAAYKELFKYGDHYIDVGNRLVDPETVCYEDPKQRTYRELLKKAPLKPTVVVTPQGVAKKYFPKQALTAALKQAGFSFAEKARQKESAEQAKRTAAQEFERRVIHQKGLALIEAVSKGKTAELLLLRYLIEQECEMDGDWGRLCKRRGWTGKTEEVLKPLDAGELRGVLVELRIQGWADSEDYYDDFQIEKLEELFPVDRKAIEAAVKCDLAAAAKAAKAKEEPEPAKDAKQAKGPKTVKLSKPVKKGGK